jgi:hypothetical protein
MTAQNRKFAPFVTVKRFARWIDRGPFRFSFACVVPMRREWLDDLDPFDTESHLAFLYRISDRNGRASLYRSVPGGFLLAGFAMGSEPLQIGYISVDIFDRLAIESELL